MPSTSKADFTRDRMPLLGTWVTLVQGGTKGSKARRSNTQSTPALIAEVSDGTVTVIYPNNLVLRHGFKGEPVKRVTGVSVERLRRFSGSDVSLQLLEKAILTAVKADACTRVPTTPLRRAPAMPQLRPLSGESGSEGERNRSRSRSPLRNAEDASPKTPRNRISAKTPRRPLRGRRFAEDIDDASPRTASPKTPRNRIIVKTEYSRCLARQDTDDKVCASPRPAQQREEEKIGQSVLPYIAAIATPGGGAELGLSTEQDAYLYKSPKSIAKRKAALTSLVSRELRGSSTYGRLTRDALEASLLEGGFKSCEINDGLQRLDDTNKIMLMDSLVFLV